MYGNLWCMYNEENNKAIAWMGTFEPFTQKTKKWHKADKKWCDTDNFFCKEWAQFYLCCSGSTGGLLCCHVGVQNKRKFVHVVCIKIGVNLQRRKIILSLYTNMAAMTSHTNHQYLFRILQNPSSVQALVDPEWSLATKFSISLQKFGYHTTFNQSHCNNISLCHMNSSATAQQ